MISKGTKAYSVFNNKCPRCHEGDFFKYKSGTNIRHFAEMHDYCPVCNLSYIQEPGYYYGAMYVSYAINVAIMVTIWVAFMVLAPEHFSIWWMVLLSVIAGVGLAPFTFRLARLLWINFFIRYDRTKASQVNGK